MSEHEPEAETKTETEGEAGAETGRHADESASSAETDASDEAVLKSRIAALEEENARLKRAYGSARRSQYRRTAFGLVAIGLLATAGGFILPESRDVLFALGGTGLFAGVLTYYLTPEQFIAASVGEKVYSALVENGTEQAAELGLTNVAVYVPPSVGETRSTRLFVPQRADYDLPDPDELDRTFVTAEGSRRGVAFHPTGEGLYREFERSLSATVADRPEPLSDQLADAVVEQFELAGGVRTDVDASGGRATFEVSDSFFGDVDRFDHPVPSFVAVGLARALGRSVEVDVTRTEDDRGEYLITCIWTPDESPTDSAPEGEVADSTPDAEAEEMSSAEDADSSPNAEGDETQNAEDEGKSG